MKKLFYFLVAVNIGFVVWIFFSDESTVVTRQVSTGQDPSLVLLSEVKEPPVLHEPEETSFSTQSEAPTVTPMTVEPPPIESKLEPEAQTEPEQSVTSDSLIPEQQVEADSKTDEKEQVADVAATDTAETPKINKETISCYVLGPFPTMASADIISEKFEKAGIEAKARLHLERQKEGYLIYIPTEGSKETANKIIASIKSNGIDDYAILTVGGVPNTVVAGIYRTNTAAERRIKQLKEHGFDAQFMDHIRKRPLFLVDFREKDSRPVPENFWTELSRDYPKANRRPQVCE